MATQLVQQRFHLVSQLGDVAEAKGCRATLDGVDRAKYCVDCIIRGPGLADIREPVLKLLPSWVAFL